MASSSSSGVSAIVSKLEMLGLRERTEVGVEGMEDAEEWERVYVSSLGKASLNLVAESAGECGFEVGVRCPAEVTWYNGEAGRRLRIGNELV
jgi:hypothetical protein